MNELLKSSLRTHWQRYVATAIAIALATAFIAVCFGISGAFRVSIERNISEETRGADIVMRVTDASTDVIDATVNALENDSRVKAVERRESAGLEVKFAGSTAYGRVLSIAKDPFIPPHLESGEFPTQDHQIALIRPMAEALHANIGDQITLTTSTYGADDDAPTQEQQTFTICGLVTAGAMSFNSMYVTDASLKTLNANTNTIVVATDASVDTVKSIVGQANANDFEIRTQSDDVDHQLSSMMEGQVQLTILLLLFPAIAVVTAIIVISTTFQVLLTQRQRELALIRAIGADRGQVRRLVLAETFAVGVIASAVGLLLGIGCSVAVNQAAKLTQSLSESLSALNPWALLGTFITGILIAVIAGFGPARRASAVSPLAALQPEDAAPTRRKRHLIRLTLMVLGFAAGAALIWASRRSVGEADNGQVFIMAFFGGFCVFVAALLLCSIASAYLTAGVGKLLGWRSPITALAGENTRRNPGRTGATVTALILGITLVVMMLVGGASMRETLRSEVDRARPLDLTMIATQPLSDSEVSDLRQLENVEQSVAIEGVKAEIVTTVDGQEKTPPVGAVFADTDLTAVAHSDLVHPQANQVAVNGWDWLEGMKVRIAVGDKTWDLEPVATRTPGFTVSSEVFQQMVKAAKAAGDQPGIYAVYAKFGEQTTSSQATATMSKAGSTVPYLMVNGGGFERIMMMELLNAVMLGVLAMLGVSVLVALVGVTNTLSLSVVERRRENALLRAVGMTRSGVRAMLMVEAALLGLVAIVVGSAMGIGFGWLGVISMPLNDVDPILVVPWWQLGGVALVTLVAALLASILPGRKAAKAAPVEALAHA